MDENDSPELAISDNARFIYIFKYDINTDSFTLWYKTNITWDYLMGSKKIGYGRGTSYAVFYLNQQGDEESSLRFHSDGFYNKKKDKDDSVYMIGLPEFKDKNRKIELSETMMKQAYTDESEEDVVCFRVTEEQWKVLTNYFFELRNQAEKNIKEIEYTYNELFGDLL